MEISYQNIKPLIKKEVAQGNQIQLEFQAKNQETPLVTVAVVIPNTKDMTKNVGKEVVKSTVKKGVINGIFNAIGLGGLLGSTVRRAANDASRNRPSKNIATTKVSEKDKQSAIVESFKSFSTMYKYNEQNKEWEYIHQQ
jgi:hypothetical protein